MGLSRVTLTGPG